MTDREPEALRLADALAKNAAVTWGEVEKAAEILRRLYKENQWLRDRLAQEAALDKMVAENERLGLYDNQKPVAWMCKNKHGNTVFFTDQQSLKSADLVDWEVIPLVRQP